MARQRLEVTGNVQGVGFRPFVYRLAHGLGLGGFVCNAVGGVLIEVQGPALALTAFAEGLCQQPPPLARVAGVRVAAIAEQETSGFEIQASRGLAGTPTVVGADAAPCAACRADYFDPSNRRHLYAFTNCTNCGPRYTISIRLPYDRCNTALAGFVLCAACAAEYDAPGNRRFHAQPNACPDCGPELSCGERRGEAALAWVRRQLRSGAVVALKNVGGYQLACDARCQAAVERLRRSKRRPRKPFALLARDLASAERCCQVDEIEGRALLEAARPIVLLAARGDPPGVAAAVAPGQRRLGVMLPSSPLHELLFATAEPAPPLLVMTSGNRGALPIAASEEQARRQLGGIADCFLDHNRAIARPVDDSVGSCFEGRLRLWRRARGYVPLAIELGGDGPTVLAAGADLKNTFCLARGSEGFLSPHIGDLENDETAAYYSDTLNRYLEMLGARPQAVAHDPHPGYHVSRMARRWAADHDVRTLIAVQHHHAHIASCMADNGVQGEVLGVAFDGTGYGEDGTVWGGEFLWASYTGFRRSAHLRPVRLWGGDRAVREPWRAGLAWLVEAFGPEAAAAAAALWPAMEPAQRTQLKLGLQVLQRPGLTFWCSAAGRLFDAVAAMVGLAPPGHEASFEGEAGLALENAATAGCGGCAAYPFSLSPGQPAAVDLRPTIRAIAADRRGGTGIETIAGRFHQTMADIIGTTCRHLREERWRSGGALETPARVCLSGGVFQNELLLAAAAAQLRGSGFEVLIHTQVPANDGGLALGQAVVARARLPRPPPTGTRSRWHGRSSQDALALLPPPGASALGASGVGQRPECAGQQRLTGAGPCPCSAETLAAPRPHSKGGAGPGPVSPRGRERPLATAESRLLWSPELRRGAGRRPARGSATRPTGGGAGRKAARFATPLRTIDGRGPLPLLAETLAAPRPHSMGFGGPARGPASPSRRGPRSPSRRLCQRANGATPAPRPLCSVNAPPAPSPAQVVS